MTTVDMIKDWLNDGTNQKATHCIIVCDTFDHEEYPVYVSRKQDVRNLVKKIDGKNMQRVIEVYNLKKPLDYQLATRYNCEF